MGTCLVKCDLGHSTFFSEGEVTEITGITLGFTLHYERRMD